MIVDLDELDLRELFEIGHQGTGNRVERPVRLALPGEINIHAAVQELDFAIPRKAIIDHCEPLIAFHISGTLEELVEHSTDYILRRGGKANHRDFIRKLTGEQAIIICEVHLDAPVHRCTCG